jgi:hypothetical protein
MLSTIHEQIKGRAEPRDGEQPLRGLRSRSHDWRMGRHGWLDRLNVGIVDHDQLLYAGIYDPSPE